MVGYNLSPAHSAFLNFSSMKTWFYFDRPHNLAFYDLTTTYKPPLNLRSLLGLGHKFYPTLRLSSNCAEETFSRFHHDFYCKIFAGEDFDSDTTYDPKCR